MMFHKTAEIAMVQIKTPKIAMLLRINAPTIPNITSTPQSISFNALTSLFHVI